MLVAGGIGLIAALAGCSASFFGAPPCGFTYSFNIPAQATPGEVAVEAYPHNIDWCDDTGKNNRVSDAEIPLVRASCAARIEPLTIIR